ncbi:MAG: AraC family transcriptional regulator [Clostridia bacterium]|nr:AraC family transcriptional regulator [Clostridia bacterium]
MINLDDGKYFESSTIGEFQSVSEWIHPDITVTTHEIIYVINGEVHIAEEDEEYSLYPNELIVLDPNKRHFGFKTSQTHTSFYWFHFYTNIDIPCKLCKSDDYYDIKYLLKRLLHISNTPTYTQNAKDSAGLMILEELISLTASKVLSDRALISSISEYVRLNIKNKITVESIAHHFGYNPDYIGKLFKEYFNTGLKKYINSERIKLAKDMLFTSNMTVKQISSHLGFSTENNFIKFFVYHEHISPSKFRNKSANTHINNK